MQRSILVLISLLFSSLALCQNTYWTSGGEWIFSLADVTDDGQEHGAIMRFSPVFNIQNHYHINFGDGAGFYTGLAVRNIGFIYDEPETNIRKKYRTYTLGIPAALKFGNMDGTYFYAGYELEFPFVYKEKTFENEKKIDKFTVWFSDRTPTLYHAVYAGMQFPHGFNLKFKYYLSEFFDDEYVAVVDGVSTRPFENFQVNVFYISLSIQIIKNKKFYHEKKDMQQASRAW